MHFPADYMMASPLFRLINACVVLQMAVATSPQHWWQHAGRVILYERKAVLGSGPTGAGRCLPERRALRREHERLYLQQRLLHWRLALLLCGRLGAKRRALQKLEARLTDEEAAQFRWWAWAKRRRAMHLQVDTGATLCRCIP